MKTIVLKNFTELEQQFLKAAVKEWNDLMYTDDIDHGIATASLGGVVSSLVQKNVIAVYPTEINGVERMVGEFQFFNEEGDLDYDDAPVLVEA